MIKFNATSHEECTRNMVAMCNDGRCWLISIVFGKVTAKPYASSRNVPRTPAGCDGYYDLIYWQNGEWHNRRKPTDAMVRCEQESSDRAGGVSDGGGNPMREFKRWAKQINAKGKQHGC